MKYPQISPLLLDAGHLMTSLMSHQDKSKNNSKLWPIDAGNCLI